MNTPSPTEVLTAHLEWSEGSWVGFVFSPNEEATHALQARSPVAGRTFRPSTPQQLREGVPRLLGLEGAALTWLITDFDPSRDELWVEATDWFLMRANERRGPLLHHLGGGLLMVLPSGYRRRVSEAAPDLWSVRALVLDLPVPPPVTDSPPPVERRIAALLRRLAFQTRMRTDPWHARVRARDPGHLDRLEARLHEEMPQLTTRRDGADHLWVGMAPGEAAPSLVVDLDAPLPAVTADVEDPPRVPAALDDPLVRVDHLLRTAAATWSQGWASETLELADQALETLRRLEVRGPDRDRRDATARELSARALRELGDRTSALRHLSVAVDARQRLAGLYGDDRPQRRRELARAHSLRGQLLLEGPRPAEAMDDLFTALELRREVATWSDDPESLAELALAHSLIGDALLAMDPADLPRAEAACREALSLRRRIVDAVDAPRHRRQLGLAWGRLGRTLSRQLHLTEAERAWEQAVEQAVRVTRIDPRPIHTVEESVARTQLADVRWKRGDPEGARQQVTHAIAQRRRLLEDDPANARWTERLAVALGQGAEHALHDGDLGQAETWAREAVALGRQLMPSTGSQIRGLALAHLRLGDVFAALERPADATGSWSDAEALIPALEGQSPDRARTIREALALRGRPSS